MDDHDLTNLTRRKVLGSLGVVGAGAALGGAGTAAFFSDTETFTDNQMVAGSLDLKVDWQQTYDGPDGLVPVNAYPDNDDNGLQSVVRNEEKVEYDLANRNPITLQCDELSSGDGLPKGVYANDRNPNQRHLVELTDVKPGDSGEITFSLHLCDNPGYLWLEGDLTANRENSMTEPELRDGDDNNNITSGDWNETQLADSQINESELAATFPTDDQGELADEILVTLWYDTNCNNVYDTEGEGSETAIGDETILENVTLRQALSVLSMGPFGLPLDANPTDDDGQGPRDCFSGKDEHCIGFEWHLPVDHANEIQTDSVAFDLQFYGEQCRHNDGSGMVENLSTGFSNWTIESVPSGANSFSAVSNDGMEVQTVTTPPSAWATVDPNNAKWVNHDGGDVSHDDHPVGEYLFTNSFELTHEGTLNLVAFSGDDRVDLSLETESGDIPLPDKSAPAYEDFAAVEKDLSAGTYTLKASVYNNEEGAGNTNPVGLLVQGHVA